MSITAPGRHPIERSSQYPLVKVCGLTRARDIALAAELGAWAVGFVFAASPRRTEPAAVRGLVRSAGLRVEGRAPLVVGVFGDTTVEAIAATIDSAGLDGVQLHGARPDAGELRRGLGEAESRVLIVQVISVPAASGAVDTAQLCRSAAAAREAADVILFDTHSGSRSGGTGQTFSWETARLAADSGRAPFLVAGGIGPHNVREALGASGAWGVDVSSGVERAPGLKDEALLRALFTAAVDASPHPAERPADVDREQQEGTRS